MHARRLPARELATLPPGALEGAVLLATIPLDGERLWKGTVIDAALAARLRAAAGAGTLEGELRLGWRDAGDLHEDDAARRLAGAVAGTGLVALPPRQSRLDLAAAWDGVLHVRAEPLVTLNAIDPVEVFTLFHGQAVARGDVVASVKVAPHIVAAAPVDAAIAIAAEHAPLLSVRPYLPLVVPAIVTEQVAPGALARFEAGAAAKLASLGARFGGVRAAWDADPAAAVARVRAVLEEVTARPGTELVLVSGVSAGDPLAPFYEALGALGGRVLRRGLPAHPGSMLWLAQLGATRFLGLPQCGMFSQATAADLVLPRLVTGEELDARALAELAHGGLLTRDMRFRFPPYARGLEAPE